ncbi:MAG: DNA polymerase III, subunit gamma and tau [Flavobacteriaceae bacterium]|nr:DNA polymerase III, subunit gamma and tau [Flavobacteriaceae bacterium]
MSQYIISALKYRPTDFNEIIGQSSITQTLINAINSNQLPQALLFSGPRGVGKTSCARILARKINNQKKEDDIKFNIFELDAASNNSVDDIRNLNEQVRIPPQLGNYKIYIIDEAHMLSTAAFNAFLKTLEEPPKHAIFILATTEKNKIIPTILSRCQIYDFKTITNIDISLHLKNISKKNNIKFEDEALNIISENADGAMRDALSLYDRLVNLTNGNLTASEVSNNLSILDTDIYIELTKKILNNDIPLILIYLDEILKKGFSHLDFLNGLSNYFRNLMLSKNSNTLKYINSEKSILNKIINQSKNIKIKSIIKCIGIINFSEINYKESKNKRLHVEFCILDIANKLSNSKKKK